MEPFVSRIPQTPIVEALPSTVPFVGPEALERQRGVAFKARLGANESGFGPAPSVKAVLQAGAVSSARAAGAASSAPAAARGRRRNKAIVGSRAQTAMNTDFVSR